MRLPSRNRPWPDRVVKEIAPVSFSMMTFRVPVVSVTLFSEDSIFQGTAGQEVLVTT